MAAEAVGPLDAHAREIPIPTARWVIGRVRQRSNRRRRPSGDNEALRCGMRAGILRGEEPASTRGCGACASDRSSQRSTSVRRSFRPACQSPRSLSELMWPWLARRCPWACHSCANEADVAGSQ